MAYMVARTEKRKAGDLGGYQIHVDRKTDNHGNKDIDNERSHLNYDLVGHSTDTSFKKEILDFIEENKSSTRATRKDAVVLQDWLISSSNNFFADLSTEETRKYFECAVTYFQERFGKENVRFATVHMDESTPHMHLGIVPFDADNKLTAKTIFNRACLKSIQEELPKHFQRNGFAIERGKEKSEAQHVHPESFKKQAEKAELEARKEGFEYVIDEMLEAIEELPGVEESDFSKTADLVEKFLNDDEEIDPRKLDDSVFLRFLTTLFQEIKQFFARMSQKNVLRSAEIDLRENSLTERENALETKIESFKRMSDDLKSEKYFLKVAYLGLQLELHDLEKERERIMKLSPKDQQTLLDDMQQALAKKLGKDLQTVRDETLYSQENGNDELEI
ncbi:plasmid recombination protein [Enterococcus sp. DIV1298c]|uniref:MobV family relaxase n=1 Tax=Enterococcus sp. DIV1298c TaxID=2815328 RepID=UPI001A9184A3|nr:MobV family relaxase [Enterococcus sp. DIV1298c]MBO0462675.1 plasmid recombination protein [Enterococcus sp. DIV1298c]